MSRISVAERARLSLLIGSRALQSLSGRLNSHPLLRWRLTSAATDRLIIAPQELRTADATRASEIYAGRFAFAGKVVICDRRSPFEMTPPSEEWAGDAARLRLAAPSARRRQRDHPRQCPLADRRLDHPARALASACAGAPIFFRAGLFHGSRRRRWRCRMPTSSFTAATSAAWSGRCAISASPPRSRATGCHACRR